MNVENEIMQCYYDVENTNTHGLLYHWYALDDNRNLAPQGWHVATDEEWKKLEVYLGMSESDADLSDILERGTDEGAKLKAQNGWFNDGNLHKRKWFFCTSGRFPRFAHWCI